MIRYLILSLFFQTVLLAQDSKLELIRLHDSSAYQGKYILTSESQKLLRSYGVYDREIRLFLEQTGFYSKYSLFGLEITNIGTYRSDRVWIDEKHSTGPLAKVDKGAVLKRIFVSSSKKSDNNLYIDEKFKKENFTKIMVRKGRLIIRKRLTRYSGQRDLTLYLEAIKYKK
ncbi:hypothetical protein N9O57_02235 [bacterium]|nr:hypothetical protein [bacterium]